MIKITLLPAAVIKAQGRGPAIIAALVAKMNQLMIRLQSKVIGEKIPQLFPHGASNIPATVRLDPAHQEGTKIVGGVLAGGPRTTKRTLRSGREVDYSGVQEYGIDHSYEILPFNKKVLSFLIDGKRVFARRVLHPPLTARPYMRESLHEMSPEIIQGLEQTFLEEVNG